MLIKSLGLFVLQKTCNNKQTLPLYADLEASNNTLKQQRATRLQFPDANVQHPNAKWVSLSISINPVWRTSWDLAQCTFVMLFYPCANALVLS